MVTLADLAPSNRVSRIIANYILPFNLGFIEGSMNAQGLDSGYTPLFMAGAGGLSALQSTSHELRELNREAIAEKKELALEDKVKAGFYGAGKGGVKAGLSLSLGYVIGRAVGTLF